MCTPLHAHLTVVCPNMKIDNFITKSPLKMAKNLSQKKKKLHLHYLKAHIQRAFMSRIIVKYINYPI